MFISQVKAGDQVIPARSFNHMATAAEHVHRALNRLSEVALPAIASEVGVITVKNTSGENQKPLNILALQDLLVTPSRNLALFKRQHIFNASLPTDADTKLAVLMAPIKADEYGPAMVSGICSVLIEMADSGHEYAVPIAAQTSKLASSAAGPARILWAESGVGLKWAVIQFPASAGGSSTSWALLSGEAEGTVPPFVYSAVAAQIGANRVVTATVGGATYSRNITNVAEQQPAYAGGKLPSGTPVILYAATGGYVFDKTWYRGAFG